MLYQNITNEQLLALVTEAVQKVLAENERKVPVGISMRHVHLCEADLARLFGVTYALTPYKTLSQPGQFAAEECVDVIGPKGVLKRVRILGPIRKETQVELAQTDCRNIGVKAPVRASGDLAGTPGITLKGPCGEISVDHGVIIADRHIHLSPEEALSYGLADGDRVKVAIEGEKSGVMGGVLIRSGEKHRMDFHIDTDDGNAFQLKQGQLVTILEKEE
jgi:putative phosphotransacetylase